MITDKRSLIDHFTNGRTTSSKEMYEDQCDDLIQYLSEIDPGQKMKRKIYFLAYELGVCEPGDDVERKINKASLDAFLTRVSYLHKRLDEYAVAELPKLVNQLEQIRKHNRDSATRKEAKSSVNSLLDELGISKQ